MTDSVFDAVWALGLAAAVAIPVVATVGLRRVVPGLRFTSSGIGAGAGIAAVVVFALWVYDSVARPTEGLLSDPILWDVVPLAALLCLLAAGVAAVVGYVRVLNAPVKRQRSADPAPPSVRQRTSPWFWLSVAAVCAMSAVAQTLWWLVLLLWFISAGGGLAATSPVLK